MAVAFDKLKFAASSGNNPAGALTSIILKNINTIIRTNPEFIDDPDCGLLAAMRSVLADPLLTKHQLLQMFRNINFKAPGDAFLAQIPLEEAFNYMVPRIIKKYYAADWNGMMSQPMSPAELLHKQRLGELGENPTIDELRFLSHFAGRNLRYYTGADPTDHTPPHTPFTNFDVPGWPQDKIWESPEGFGYEDGELATPALIARKAYNRSMQNFNKQEMQERLRLQLQAMNEEQKNSFDLKAWHGNHANPSKNNAALVPYMLDQALGNIFHVDYNPNKKGLPVLLDGLKLLFGGIIALFLKMNAVMTQFAQKVARFYNPDAPITPETDPEVFQHPETARFVELVGKLPQSNGLNQLWVKNPGSKEAWAKLKEELESNGLYHDLDKLLRHEEKEVLEKAFDGLKRNPNDGAEPTHNGAILHPKDIFQIVLRNWRSIPLSTASEEFRAAYMEMRQEMVRLVKAQQAESRENSQKLRTLETRRVAIIKELEEANQYLEMLQARTMRGDAINPADQACAIQRMRNAQDNYDREIGVLSYDPISGAVIFDPITREPVLNPVGVLTQQIEATKASLERDALDLAQKLDDLVRSFDQIHRNEAESQDLRRKAANVQLQAAANPNPAGNGNGQIPPQVQNPFPNLGQMPQQIPNLAQNPVPVGGPGPRLFG